MIGWVYRLAGALLRPIYRFQVSGRERLPDGGCIVCANHTANIDGALLALAMDTTDVVPMAKAELLRAPVLGGFLRRMGVVPVRRGESDLGAVRAALTALKRGQKLVIFPEGTRVTDGAELAGKTGAAMLASKANVPIVPAHIPAGKKAFRRCRVVFGSAIEPLRARGHDAYRLLTEQVMAEIRALGQEELS